MMRKEMMMNRLTPVPNKPGYEHSTSPLYLLANKILCSAMNFQVDLPNTGIKYIYEYDSVLRSVVFSNDWSEESIDEACQLGKTWAVEEKCLSGLYQFEHYKNEILFDK